jgi:hypothetical protein
VITQQTANQRAATWSMTARLLPVAVLLATVACLDALEPVAVDVHPRVVLDGSVELSDRTRGRIFVHEVVAHAAAAELTAAVAGALPEALLTDDDSLLFRYHADDASGFGALADGVRTWLLPASGASLRVGFAPLSAARADVLATKNGVPLDDLVGHSAIVRGTIALTITSDGGWSGFGAGQDRDFVDPDGSPAVPGDTVGETDPDGAPITPADEEQTDPDGAPAEPVDPDGSAAAPDADVDPDGSPAAPGGDVGDIDPDGGPATPAGPSSTDPDGAPGVIDPDGSPARTADRSSLSMTLDRIANNGRQAQKGAQARTTQVVRVPFVLAIEDEFLLQALIGSDAILDVKDGEVLPIDLHLSVSRLFSAERVAQLQALALAFLADPQEDEAVSVAVDMGVQRVLGVVVDAVGVRRPQQDLRQTAGRIAVTGDLRR